LHACPCSPARSTSGNHCESYRRGLANQAIFLLCRATPQQIGLQGSRQGAKHEYSAWSKAAQTANAAICFGLSARLAPTDLPAFQTWRFVKVFSVSDISMIVLQWSQWALEECLLAWRLKMLQR
jgi:hypothetical protein